MIIILLDTSNVEVEDGGMNIDYHDGFRDGRCNGLIAGRAEGFIIGFMAPLIAFAIIWILK